MSSILRQDIPQDTQAVLDFDLVMYISFRPAMVTMEFGGLVRCHRGYRNFGLTALQL